MPGMLHAAFLRSQHAHARIVSIATEAARAMPGVHAVLTAAELHARLTSSRLPIAFPAGQLPPEVMPQVMAAATALYVGETLAIVVADSRALAEDAVDAISIVYEPLSATVMPTPDDIFKRFDVGYGDTAAAFARAVHVVGAKLAQHRGCGVPIETRGVLARPDNATGDLCVWSSTQLSHELRSTIGVLLGLPDETVRVIAPDVGGGFGVKYMVYPEEIAVAAAACYLRRPVKWIEDRQEHLLSAIQERNQHWDLELALAPNGVIIAVRGTLLHDQGAYAPHSVNVPFNAAVSLPGAYRVPHYALSVIVARTNLVPVIPIRGAGYPQGCFALERLLDVAALELGLDRAEIRSRNLVTPAEMPYATPMRTRAGAPITLDSGDYPACQAIGLKAIDYAGFPARQAVAKSVGRRLGIGLAHAVKGTGRGPFESGMVRVHATGRVSVCTGALAMGQGLKTALAQIAADTLGVPFDRVDVTAGDTSRIFLGLGGYASRQTVTAGSSILLAARTVRAKVLEVASSKLEVSVDDLVINDGRVHVDGVPGMGIELGDIAATLRGLPGYDFPNNVTPGLSAEENYRIDLLAYANAFHVCEVEADVRTGAVKILRYIAVHDSGRLVNPAMAAGQFVGGVAHGIGNALFERMIHDAQGQPLTTTLADYMIPTATDLPAIELHIRETPSPNNPLGAKGAGEAGVIPVAAAIASAVEHALAEFGVQVRSVPISPVDLLAQIPMGAA